MLSYLEIDLKKIAENTKNLKKSIGQVKLLAVLKANAYGHGLLEVAKTVAKSGADCLGVNFIEEGLALRKAKITTPILIFGWPDTIIALEVKALEEKQKLSFIILRKENSQGLRFKRFWWWKKEGK